MMIHLDTNHIIGLVAASSPANPVIQRWLQAGEIFAVSAVAWSEFLCGPVTPQEIRDASAMIESRIVAFGAIEAEMAARIFNRTGRNRGTRVDCFIAATAICARMPLATANRKDFLPFVPHGLQLA